MVLFWLKEHIYGGGHTDKGREGALDGHVQTWTYTNKPINGEMLG